VVHGVGESTLLRAIHGDLPAGGEIKRAEALSGGERLRATSACVLFAEPAPQLLLPDEPTNNLDPVGIGWSEDALNAYQGAFVVVGLDRRFLSNRGDALVAALGGAAAGDRGTGRRPTAAARQPRPGSLGPAAPARRQGARGQSRSASTTAWANSAGASCGTLWPTSKVRCRYFPVKWLR
jgi:hypothetical protein